MNFDLINAIPRDLPRRGPAKWSKSADRDCPCRRYWLEHYRSARLAMGAQDWVAYRVKGLPHPFVFEDPAEWGVSMEVDLP